MLIKTDNKWEAVRALMNTLLKDKSFYCNYCGKDCDGNLDCCEQPQIGRHMDHVRGCIKQNKETRDTRLNEFGSTKSKSMRWGISIPPKFLSDLERAFKSTYNEKLLKDNKDMHRFMREFPAFRTCNSV